MAGASRLNEAAIYDGSICGSTQRHNPWRACDMYLYYYCHCCCSSPTARDDSLNRTYVHMQAAAAARLLCCFLQLCCF